MKTSTALVLTGIWFILALAIDRWLLHPFCAACTDLAALSLELSMPAVPSLSYPRVGVLVLIGLPLLLSALLLLPWKKPLSDRSSWSTAVDTWCKPLLWGAIGLGCVVLGEMLYLLLSWLFPSSSFLKFLEAFSLKVVLNISGHDFLSVKATLTGLVGLALGAYLFFQRGVAGLLRAAFAKAG